VLEPGINPPGWSTTDAPDKLFNNKLKGMFSRY